MVGLFPGTPDWDTVTVRWLSSTPTSCSFLRLGYSRTSEYNAKWKNSLC